MDNSEITLFKVPVAGDEALELSTFDPYGEPLRAYITNIKVEGVKVKDIKNIHTFDPMLDINTKLSYDVAFPDGKKRDQETLNYLYMIMSRNVQAWMLQEANAATKN